jgi:hypothetical protein
MSRQLESKEDYLKRMGYAQGSAVGELAYDLYVAPDNASRVAMLPRIGWTAIMNRQEGLKLEEIQQGLERLKEKMASNAA